MTSDISQASDSDSEIEESYNESSENETSNDALKKFEPDVEPVYKSSEDESSSDDLPNSGDETDDERSDEAANISNKRLKRKKHKNPVIKHLSRKRHSCKKTKIICPVLMDDSSDSSESSESDNELTYQDQITEDEEKVEKDEEF